MIIERLRTATAETHHQLDSSLTPVFKNVDDTTKYARILKAFYGFFKPVMDKISGEIDTHYLPDFGDRRKPELVLRDLEHIGADQADISYATELPQVNNASQAFGAMYVLEGSMLGGVYLSKLLAAQLGLDDTTGISFFYGYGNDSKEQWNKFIGSINNFAAEKGDESAILAAANDTFRLFEKHLNQQLHKN